VRILHTVEDEQQRRRSGAVEQFVERTFAQRAERANLQARALMPLVACESIQFVSVAPFRLHACRLRKALQLSRARILAALLQDQQRGTLGTLLQQRANGVQAEDDGRFTHRRRSLRRCHGPRMARPALSASSKSILRSSMITLMSRTRR
jgi:hypothetical protein